MIKVLIVDDEPYIRQGLQILINWELYGFEICGEASNGEEALEVMKKVDIDLIITDIKMPQMDGIELIGYTREHISKDIRFIIFSGYYEFEYAKKAIKYNVEDYILKPVQRDELIRVLEEYKRQYYRKMEEQKKQEQTEKIVFDNHMNHLISGIQDTEGYPYIKKFLTAYTQVRYIDLEYDRTDERYQMLSYEEKLKVQNLLYLALKDFLGEHCFHAYIEAVRNENDYAVGFIYAKKISDLANLSEEEYIDALYEAVKDKLSHNIILYIGQRVEDVSMISDSYKSAKIAHNFHLFSNKKNIAYYDEIQSNISADKYPVDKEEMDGLIRAIEENDRDLIQKQTDALYSHFKDWVTEPEIIKINLDYLLFNLINLARELNPDFDQEEVHKMISQGGYDQVAVRGSVKHFREFAYGFAEYLGQLRHHSFGGVLKEIEREITENYIDNLSLKSLGEKYYINSAYLGQIFKKQYGISFKDYLNNYRIDRAAELLIRSDEKIYLIASAVGFNNTDYFISKFVQLKGITPLQYRKHCYAYGGSV